MRGNAGDVLFYKREREGVTLEPDKKKGLAAKDLAFSIVLIIFSIYIIVTSLGLKYFNTFIDGAGFFPLIIGCVMLVLGIVLLYVAVRCGGVKELKKSLSNESVTSFVKSDKTLRVIILIAMMVIYMYVLVGRIHFILATSIYIFANYLYLGACQKGKFLPAWLKAILISVIASVATYYMMKLFLGITLP